MDVTFSVERAARMTVDELERQGRFVRRMLATQIEIFSTAFVQMSNRDQAVALHEALQKKKEE